MYEKEVEANRRYFFFISENGKKHLGEEFRLKSLSTFVLTFENDFTIITKLDISYIKIINILLLRFIVPYGRHEPMILVVIF